jgi:branched-chain amino acid transport system permease protein
LGTLLKNSKNISPGMLIGLSILGLVIVLLPLIVRGYYWMHVIIMTGMNAILGMTFALLFSTGLITIGAAAFWAIGAYASALLVMNLGLSFWSALPAAGVVAGIAALCVGAIIVRTPGIAFLVLTLVFCAIMQSVFGYIEVFGGWGGITSIPRPNAISIPFCGQIQFISKTPYYYLMLFVLLLTMIVFYALYTSRIGRAWRAIRLNPRLAETLGINLYAYRLMAFVIACTFAGLAGSFYAHYFLTIQPSTFSVIRSVYIQIYGILGGLEYYILGPIVGSLAMTFVPELLRITPAVEPYFTGGLLILLVLFLPKGIMSLAEWILLVTGRPKSG